MDNKRGAPVKPPDQRKSKLFAIRFTEAELEAVERAGGSKPSAWAREVLLRAAKRKA
jgi:hypothetical protein